MEHNVKQHWPNKYIFVSIHVTEAMNEGPFCVGTAEEGKCSELESGKRMDGACATFDMFSLYSGHSDSFRICESGSSSRIDSVQRSGSIFLGNQQLVIMDRNDNNYV